MVPPPDHCKHGHTGWMIQRLLFDRRRDRHYWVWVCQECARLRDLTPARRLKPRPRRIHSQG